MKKFILLLLLPSLSVFSQEQKKIIKGKLVDSTGVIKNANIVNINSKQGTLSSDIGTFEIYASLGDSLQISTIQHQTKFFRINDLNYKNKIILIQLKFKTYTLDSFDLKRHNLSGRLSIDSKTVPKSKKDSLLKITMDFSNINFNNIDVTIDENIRATPPEVKVDPNTKFEGFNFMALLSRIKLKKKKKPKKNKEINVFDSNFPKKIKAELGEAYFFEKLKIPKEKYQHFLEYCNLLEIEKLYQKGRLLEVIQILENKSISYLKKTKNRD